MSERELISDLTNLAEYWIEHYRSLHRAYIGPMSNHDYTMWLSTGLQSSTLTKAKEWLRENPSNS